MKTIDGMWKDYLERVVPKGAGSIQVEETRKAFYTGVAALMGIFNQIGGQSDNDIRQAIQRLNNEIHAFLEDIIRRKPSR